MLLILQINDRYEFPLQLDLDREDGKYLSPDADRSVRNLYTLHRFQSFLTFGWQIFLLLFSRSLDMNFTDFFDYLVWWKCWSFFFSFPFLFFLLKVVSARWMSLGLPAQCWLLVVWIGLLFFFFFHVVLVSLFLSYHHYV